MAAIPAEPALRYPRLPRWSSMAFTVAMAAFVVSSAFFEVSERPEAAPQFRDPDPLALVLLVIAAAGLFLRRRYPLVALAITIAVAVIALASGYRDEGFELAYIVAMFSVAVRVPRRSMLLLALASALVLITATLVAQPATFWKLSVGVVIGLGFATAVGDAMRMRRAYILAITERAERAEQNREAEARRRVAEDRLRIARELHDAVAHQIAVINLHAGAASQALGERPQDAERSLATIREAARGVLGEISSLLQVLRTSGDGELGGTVPGLGDLDQLVAEVERNGLRVARVGTVPGRRLPEATDSVAYRVVQEALTNAHKHCSDKAATLTLTSTGDEFVIEVRNNALFPAAPLPEAQGHGLVGMRERIEAVGGTVLAEPTPGGFLLRAALPLPAPTAAVRTAASANEGAPPQ